MHQEEEAKALITKILTKGRELINEVPILCFSFADAKLEAILYNALVASCESTHDQVRAMPPHPAANACACSRHSSVGCVRKLRSC